MAGLLDLFGSDMEDPRTGAMLALAAGLLNNPGGRRNFAPGLTQGLLGYQAVMGQAKDKQRAQAMEERKLAMEEQLRQAQIGEYRAQALQRMAAAEEAKRKGENEQRLEGLIKDTFRPVSASEANAATGIVGPRPEALSVVGKTPSVNYQWLIAQGVPPERAKALAEAPNLGMPTVARTIEGRGPNGEPVTYQLDAQGRLVGGGINKAVERKATDVGGSIKFVNPYTQEGDLTKTQTPDSKASTALGWANNALAKQRFEWEKTKPADTGPLVQIMGPNGPVWATRDDAVGKQPVGPGSKAEAVAAGRADVDKDIATLATALKTLKDNGGIVSTERGSLPNMASWLATTGAGQIVGNMFGTQEQKERNVIAQARPLLMRSIMQATGMSAKQMDSNAELKLWLSTATDPALGYEANMQALNNLAEKYGSGKLDDSGWGIKRVGE